jgi:hypothetical protein
MGSSNVLFKNPAVFVYTTIGDILLFRLLWACNVWQWKENHINYDHLLSLRITRPNPFTLLEETSLFFMLYCVNLIIFVVVGVRNPESQYNNVCPLLLLVITMGFIARHSSMVILFGKDEYRSEESPGNLFDYQTWKRCLSTPFVPVTFRDNFAADILTSFTKPISDGVYGVCWLASGSFLKPGEDLTAGFGSSYLQCNSMTVKRIAGVYIVMIPFLIRFLQCVRVIYDNKTYWPQIVNAGKYLSSILVVVYVLSGDSSSAWYYVIVVGASLYKWAWDVLMDWDLFYTDGMYPDHWILLRKELLFSPAPQYYLAIIVDLILRFVWVVSLNHGSPSLKVLSTPQFNFFFGSIEIIRRAMWNHFRVEHEHLKQLRKNSIGYIERRTARCMKDRVAPTGKALVTQSKGLMEATEREGTENAKQDDRTEDVSQNVSQDAVYESNPNVTATTSKQDLAEDTSALDEESKDCDCDRN